MEKEYYVYVWYRKTNHEPFYVGKGKNNRYTQLINRNNYFLNVYNKHGGYPEIIIRDLTDNEAIEKEIELIKEYRSKYQLTNITDGGEGVSGYNHKEETKKKLSELSKIQWSNPKTRQRLIESRRISHNKPEVREKLSKIHKGKVLTDEHRRKIKKAMNSEEVVKRLSEAHSKYRMIECIKPNGESIIFSNTRETVTWLKEQGHEQAQIASVIKCLKGERKTLYKYTFKALSEESV